MEPIRGKTPIVDPSYRYMMEKLVFQKERTKTCITNLQKITESLKIPFHTLITIFFKKRLSISIVERDDKVIITNEVDTKTIQNALYEFIEYFILCKKCKLPELTYVLDKKNVCGSCRSCGNLEVLELNQNTEKVIKALEAHLLAQAKTKTK